MTTNRLRFADDGEKKSEAERKRDLRSYMRSRRGDNENRDMKENALIKNVFSALSELFTAAGTPRSAFVYLSYSSEAPTDKLIEALQDNGITVYAPRIDGGEMYAVPVDGEFNFTASAQGIREPIGKIYDGETDFVVLPLLAADECGNRLGYGGGYYDRYLRRRRKTVRIGYAYDFQVLREIPREPWDEPLDVVVTDKRIIRTHVRGE